jgi:hypothetical protein
MIKYPSHLLLQKNCLIKVFSAVPVTRMILQGFIFQEELFFNLAKIKSNLCPTTFSSATPVKTMSTIGL